MFDELRCQMPLPRDGCAGLLFQTKDTPAQWLDQYEIREDGSLWHERYDVEDHSDPNAEGLWALIGCMTRVNKEWERCEMTGEVRFYKDTSSGWAEFSAYFVRGLLAHPIVEVPA